MGAAETVLVVLIVVAMVALTAIRYFKSEQEARKVRKQREWARKLEANQRAGKLPNLERDEYGIGWHEKKKDIYTSDGEFAGKLKSSTGLKKEEVGDWNATNHTAYYAAYASEADLASEVPHPRFKKHKLDCDSCGSPLSVSGQFAECEACGHRYYLEGLGEVGEPYKRGVLDDYDYDYDYGPTSPYCIDGGVSYRSIISGPVRWT